MSRGGSDGHLVAVGDAGERLYYHPRADRRWDGNLLSGPPYSLVVGDDEVSPLRGHRHAGAEAVERGLRVLQGRSLHSRHLLASMLVELEDRGLAS